MGASNSHNSIGTYQPGQPSIAEEFDFNIKIKLIEEDFLPLGISNFKGEKENDKIRFNIIIEGKGVNSWHFIVRYKDNVIYELFSSTIELEEVVVTGKLNKKNKSIEKNEEEQKTESKRFWPAGTYMVEWSGFDKNGIYDSTIFTSEEGLNISLAGQAEFKQKIYGLKKPIRFNYKEVDWLDLKIDRNTNKIETILRVDLQDGGENGLECSSHITGGRFNAHWETECPWDNIPASTIMPSQPIIKTRTRSFEDLKKLALEGLKQHWSRSSNNGLKVGKSISISGENYQVDLSPINSSENALNGVSLLFNTNTSWSRSGNPGFLAKLSYNVGYIKYSNGWGYQTEGDEDLDFKETAAHEIGHPILLAFANAVYSWEHKGSSYLFPQDTKSTPDNSKSKIILEKMTHKYYMETSGEYYPLNGEIDLMKYYNSKDPTEKKVAAPDSSRTVASEFDVKGLIWLTKISPK